MLIPEINRQYQLLAESRNNIVKKNFLDNTYKVMYKRTILDEWELGVDCGKDYSMAKSIRDKWLRGKYCFDVCIERVIGKAQ